ncbi:hypothetical protein DAPPUDRAFT_248449 [Daphnia pulex]|uniref:Uncharacterized protein n=1 Tax=Daphnia pulex TaxID=6669 RepID=E9GUP3_DAPPU|nr:hypothetical protein DAPPUDRAFT_248449 [Daphnia pulex]|eukprot:EFX76768.1 hypothetical protein DAPPUDRAFT_248449 [Daphnia pulex]
MYSNKFRRKKREHLEHGLTNPKSSPCQIHQLNQNQQSPSDQIYVGPDFQKQSASTSAFGSRHSTLQPQATNEKFQQVIRQDQQNSAFRPLDATDSDDEAVSLIRYLQALFKCGSFSMRSKLSAFLVPICSSHGRPFWSRTINLLDANKQPTQTNFQPNDEIQQEVDSIFSPFRFLFLIVKTARKSLKTIWRFTDWNEQPTSTLLLIRTFRTNVLPAISSNKIPLRFRLLEKKPRPSTSRLFRGTRVRNRCTCAVYLQADSANHQVCFNLLLAPQEQPFSVSSVPRLTLQGAVFGVLLYDSDTKKFGSHHVTIIHAVTGRRIAATTASIDSLHRVVSTSSVHHVPDHRKSVQQFRFAATSHFRRNEFTKLVFPQQSGHPFQPPVPRPKISRLLLLMRLKRPKRRVTTGRYGSIQQMDPLRLCYPGYAVTHYGNLSPLRPPSMPVCEVILTHSRPRKRLPC